MSNMKKIAAPLALSLALWTQFGHAAAQTYQLNPEHTSVVMSWSHFGFSHPTADISNASGTLVFDSANPEKSKVVVTLPMDTLDTHVDALNKEFKAGEYFNTGTYPQATFRSTRVISKGNQRYDVQGDLTIKGVTKPVTLHATLNKQGEHPMMKKQAIGFDATGTVKRSDFGLKQYIPAVSDEIALTISTEAWADK
ncbi:MAG: YceI family protein [Mixta calida]|uniref:YceI family protein n=1 Tax=Mixta TaxID=2100764 RepID=UPI000EE2757D|nr:MULTISPECIES: YceI family protein [Mixta]MDU3817944.1 YceI family protein [Pantoea sp.]HCW47736.1 polyisoprenoid-binding protein [Erwiniaceae bacterium]MCR1568217.1 YceI family protein [Mixta sp.]MDU4289799.1 YceI family protein [Mixta calida]MDU4942378.1 YceI family protein [Mixta calida]